MVLKPVIHKIREPTPGTLSVTLPKKFTKKLGLSRACQVQMDLEEEAIVIRKALILPPREKKGH